jgi:hypothetical protein
MIWRESLDTSLKERLIEVTHITHRVLTHHEQLCQQADVQLPPVPSVVVPPLCNLKDDRGITSDLHLEQDDIMLETYSAAAFA